MQDVVFAHKDDAPRQIAMQPIIIGTTCSASEDLQSLIQRIQHGDTPDKRRRKRGKPFRICPLL